MIHKSRKEEEEDEGGDSGDHGNGGMFVCEMNNTRGSLSQYTHTRSRSIVCACV